MSSKHVMALFALVMSVAGCAQLDAWTSTFAGREAPVVTEDTSAQTDAMYINTDAAAAARDFRNVYIAPANLANMQVIQPEGASADVEWWITDGEDKILQQAIVDAFTAALGYGSAFYIVASPEEAQIVVNTALVAIHPNVARGSTAASSNAGGAITVSIALVNARSAAVLVRAVDTRSSDDIWALNQMQTESVALNQILRAWGDSLRVGMLQLQGRPVSPVAVSAAATP